MLDMSVNIIGPSADTSVQVVWTYLPGFGYAEVSETNDVLAGPAGIDPAAIAAITAAGETAQIVGSPTVATGSGVGWLWFATILGLAGVILAANFGASMQVGYYTDAAGAEHDMPFTYVATTQDVKIGSSVYTTVGLSTTSTVPAGVDMQSTHDFAAYGDVAGDAAQESL